MAKLCNISVRTVQYYDTRGLLIPSKLSEGGRRLYSENDLKRMRVICFLRELGLPINAIIRLMAEECPENVIDLLLAQQKSDLQAEIDERQERLSKLEQLKRELKGVGHFSVESIGDVAQMMTNKKKLSQLRLFMISVGIVMDVIEVATAILWWQTGVWWPFAVGMCVIAAMAVGVSVVYFKRVAYICPQCHVVFKPKFKESFFAYHTPKTRRLKCPECGHKGLCVETYAEQ